MISNDIGLKRSANVMHRVKYDIGHKLNHYKTAQQPEPFADAKLSAYLWSRYFNQFTTFSQRIEKKISENT